MPTSISPLRAEPDQFRCRGRGVYLRCCPSYGRTKLANQAIEKAARVARHHPELENAGIVR
jgi:hypothetical protein